MIQGTPKTLLQSWCYDAVSLCIWILPVLPYLLLTWSLNKPTPRYSNKQPQMHTRKLPSTSYSPGFQGPHLIALHSWFSLQVSAAIFLGGLVGQLLPWEGRFPLTCIFTTLNSFCLLIILLFPSCSIVLCGILIKRQLSN